MKKIAPKIPYVAWRDGRPRFMPSATMRAQGFVGLDLKTEDDQWMDAGGALEWSQDFVRQIAEAKRKAKVKPLRKALPSLTPPRAVFPISNLFDEWTNVVKNPGWADISEKTQYEYRLKGKVIEKHLPDVWQSETAALTKTICLGMYDVLRTKAGIFQASVTMRVLGTALQWAMDRGKLPEMPVNPAHKLRMKTPPPRLRVGTKKEILQMVTAADAIGRPEIGDMIILGVWTGQRQSDRLQLTFVGRRKGDLVFRQQKTGVVVRIPESPEVTRRLEAMMERRKLAEVISPYVVLDERRWKPLSRVSYHRIYIDVRAAAAAGLVLPDGTRLQPMPSLLGKPAPLQLPDEEQQTLTLRDQDLRDTAVTWLALAGCTFPEICTITGHSFASANTIFKHYLALHPDMARTGMAKMVTWFDADTP